MHLGLRLSRGRFHDLVVSRLRERVVEQRKGGEREVAPLDAHEQIREAARQSRGVDAPARFVLRHAESAHAELEHRRTGRFEVEAALFYLDEVCEQAREHRPTLGTQRFQAAEELRVGEIGELHACVLHPGFLRPCTRSGNAISGEMPPGVRRSRKGRGTATSAQGRPLAWTFA